MKIFGSCSEKEWWSSCLAAFGFIGFFLSDDSVPVLRQKKKQSIIFRTRVTLNYISRFSSNVCWPDRVSYLGDDWHEIWNSLSKIQFRPKLSRVEHNSFRGMQGPGMHVCRWSERVREFSLFPVIELHYEAWDCGATNVTLFFLHNANRLRTLGCKSCYVIGDGLFMSFWQGPRGWGKK